jgi:EAL and modified HD-GYP domain-containing signal transduction protein
MPDPDIDEITKVIEKDLSVSYKLLKLINSPAIRPKYEISSIKQAVVLLGLIEIKKWIFVLALKGLSAEKSDQATKEIIYLSLTRAKLGELIGIAKDRQSESSKYFLLGMFSLIDALLHMPLKSVLAELPLASELKDAIEGRENELKRVLDLIIAIERMELSNRILELELTSSLNEDLLFSLYSKASIWASWLLKE